MTFEAVAPSAPARPPTSSRWPPGRPRTPRCTRWPTPWSRRTDDVLAANAEDVAAAREAGTPEALVDRLRLDAGRVAAMADGLRDVAALPDPVGEVVRGSTLANGLELRQVRVPFGVVGIIYEARPNVTADAAGICLKSGNAVLLRGSSQRPALQRGDRRRAPRRGRRGRPAGRRRPAGPGGGPRGGQGADAGPRAGRRADPARRRRPDPLGRRGVHGAGDRDRRRQLPRVRRPRRRPRHGAGDRAQRQDPPPVGVQRRRVAAGARRRRRRVRAAGRRAPCRTPASPCTATRRFAAPGRRGAGDRGGPPDGVPLPRPLRVRRARPGRGAVRAHPDVLLRAHRGDRHRLAGRPPAGSPRPSTPPR